MSPDVRRENRSLTRSLVLMVAGSFAFGFALVPLYKVICEAAGIRVNDFATAVAVLALNSSAYLTEIFRAGLQSISYGQREAALAIGMTPWQVMRRIILPQATKVIIPPLGNEFNNMMKTTSLLVIISAPELFYAFTQINARLFKPFELFIALSFSYIYRYLLREISHYFGADYKEKGSACLLNADPVKPILPELICSPAPSS